jgi:hypothetical protein
LAVTTTLLRGAIAVDDAAGIRRLAPLAGVEAESDDVIVHVPGLAAMSVSAPGVDSLMKIAFGLSAAAQ